VRPLPYTTKNGVRRPGDADHRASGDDAKPDRKIKFKLQSGNTNHDRKVAVGRPSEVKGRTKLNASGDGKECAQVLKAEVVTSVPADREQADTIVTGHPLTPEQDDSTRGPRRLSQKTSSSSSLLERSQNFFARLRGRKNDPSKTSKSADGGSKTKIRRSISESGCTMYANRELVINIVNDVGTSPCSAHVVTEHQKTGGQFATSETVDGNAAGDSTKDHATTTTVCAEVEPSTGEISTDADVVQHIESTSGLGQVADSTAVHEECSGLYSLREARLQRGGDTAVLETSTSTTSSHIIHQESSLQSEDHQVHLRTVQMSSLHPDTGTVFDGCRSVPLAVGRRRKLVTHSSSCIAGGRRDGRLERIQEVDSPPGSADAVETPIRPADAGSSVVTDQCVRSNDATHVAGDAHNRKFAVHHACTLHL